MHLQKKWILLFSLLVWFTTSSHSAPVSSASAQPFSHSGSFISSYASEHAECMEHGNAPAQSFLRHYRLNDLNIRNLITGKHAFFPADSRTLLCSVPLHSYFSLHRALLTSTPPRFYIRYHRLIV